MTNITKCLLCFLFFQENKICQFIQTVSHGENVLEISKPVFLEKIEKNISTCRLLNFYPAGKELQ